MGIGNPQNLKVPTSEEARKNGSKGGKASAEARKRKKLLRECLEELLERKVIGSDGKKITGADEVAIALYRKATKGDVKAFEALRDTIGQKPIDKVQTVQTVDLSHLSTDELRALLDDEVGGA